MPSDDIRKATDFLNETSTGKITVAAKVYGANVSTLCMRLQRVKQQHNTRRVNNIVLSDVQIQAIQRYIQRSYENGYGATKPMVFNAVC